MKVFIIAALTADGFIARGSNHLSNWTSPEDKKLFVSLTKEAGVMVMGSRTFKTFGKALPGRRSIVYTTRPEELMVDGVEVTNEPPHTLLSRLRSEGANGVAITGGAIIYDMFIRSGLVNELYLTIEPKLFGSGVQLFSGKLEIDLMLMQVRQLNQDTVLLHYKLQNRED